MLKALVVDDSRAIRMILSRILKELNYEVCEAGNGRDALDVLAAEKNAIDLILADWNMPEMNGLDLLKRVRANPQLASMAVVMVTTETELDQMAAKSAGLKFGIHLLTGYGRERASAVRAVASLDFPVQVLPGAADCLLLLQPSGAGVKL